MIQETKAIEIQGRTDEQILICMILSGHDCAKIILERLEDEDFFPNSVEQILFRSAKEIFHSGISIESMTYHLKSNNHLDLIGGVYNLVTFFSSIFEKSNLDYKKLIENVKEKSIRRKMHDECQKAISYIESPYESYADHVKRFRDKIDDLIKKQQPEEKKVEDLCNFDSWISDIRRNEKDIDIGFEVGDLNIQFRLGAISVIAMATGHGKTLSLINCTLRALERNPVKVAFFTCEETRGAVAGLLLNAYMGIDLGKNNRKKIRQFFAKDPALDLAGDSIYTLQEACEDFCDQFCHSEQLALHYVEESVEELCAMMDTMAKQGYKLFMIDYIQYLHINRPRASRQEQLKEICMLLKDCAVRNNIAIVVGAQFNRSVELPEDMSLTAIGEAGDIERIANLVLCGYNMSMLPEGDERRANRIFYKIMKSREMPAGASFYFEVHRNSGRLVGRPVASHLEKRVERKTSSKDQEPQSFRRLSKDEL